MLSSMVQYEHKCFSDYMIISGYNVANQLVLRRCSIMLIEPRKESLLLFLQPTFYFVMSHRCGASNIGIVAISDTNQQQ